jgi:hypothetical protein
MDSSASYDILLSCAKMGDLKQGIGNHQKAKGIFSDAVVAHTLVGRYVKCGSIEKAYENVVVTTLVNKYAKCGIIYKAHKIFDKLL